MTPNLTVLITLRTGQLISCTGYWVHAQCTGLQTLTHTHTSPNANGYRLHVTPALYTDVLLLSFYHFLIINRVLWLWVIFPAHPCVPDILKRGTNTVCMRKVRVTPVFRSQRSAGDKRYSMRFPRWTFQKMSLISSHSCTKRSIWINAIQPIYPAALKRWCLSISMVLCSAYE